jgi:hypothetical protein
MTRQSAFAFGKTLSISCLLASLALAGCSHARKKTPELSDMVGKKVALIEVDGEGTARSVVEVALINQLVKNGTFEVLSKEAVNASRADPTQDPRDWLGIARRAGADYGLKAKVLEFFGEEKQGYSTEEVYDSQLAAERGEKEGKTQRLYKVKSLTGRVRVQLDFTRTDEKDPDPRSAVAEQDGTITAEAKTEAAHLPPRLRYLETLANEAFQKFFEQYK